MFEAHDVSVVPSEIVSQIENSGVNRGVGRMIGINYRYEHRCTVKVKNQKSKTLPLKSLR